MLILSRKTGQSIMIGKNIKLTLMSNEKGQVKIGIDAPKNIEVHREEIYQKIHYNEDNKGNVA